MKIRLQHIKETVGAIILYGLFALVLGLVAAFWISGFIRATEKGLGLQ